MHELQLPVLSSLQCIFGRCHECAVLALHACSQAVPMQFIRSPIRLFICFLVYFSEQLQFTQSLTHSFAHSFLGLGIQSVSGSFVHSFVRSFIHLFMSPHAHHNCIRKSARPPAHSFVRSVAGLAVLFLFSQPHVRALIRSFVRSFVRWLAHPHVHRNCIRKSVSPLVSSLIARQGLSVLGFTAVRRLFVRVLVRSFVPAVVRSFIPSFVRSLMSLHICHFIRKSVRPPTNSFIRSIAGIVMCFLIQSVSGSFVRLFIRSFILPKMKDLRCRYQTRNDDTPITPEIRTSRHCF